MLSPDDRQLYTKCFRVPEHHVFDCGVGTTFSVDLETLMFVPIALTSSALEEPRAVLGDPVALLGAIHQIGERLTVFCDDGHTNAPSLHHPLYALLEDSFVPARASGEGAIFHPKLWLLRFRQTVTGDVVLRAVVLSRNITASRCWDTLVQLEGTPNPKLVVPDSAGLAGLVRALPKLASGDDLPEHRTRQIDALAADAARTPFYAPAPFDEETRATFVALGTGDNQQWNPGDGERALAISPFLSDAALHALSRLANDRILISREETLDRCDREVLGEWKCFGLHDAAGGEAEVAEDETVGETADSVPHGLHAKGFAIESGKRTVWWLGSANLTDPVLAGTNVELLVRLEGRTRDVGIDRFLEGGFQALLRRYDETTPQSSTTPEEEALGLAEKAQHLVVRSELRGNSEWSGTGDWTLTICGDLELPDGVTLELRPITLPAGHARKWPGSQLEFRGLAMEALTAFIACEIEARKGGATARTSFTCKVPVAGLPKERLDRIVRSVIRDRTGLLNYLRRLLAGVDGGILEAPAGDRTGRGGGNRDGLVGSDPMLLENIVRALRRSPERLQAIDQTLRRLADDGVSSAGESIVPADLLELWKIVRHLISGHTGGNAARLGENGTGSE